MNAARTNELPSWLLSQSSLRAQRILTARLASLGARTYHLRVLETLADAAPLSQIAIGSLAGLDRRDVAVTLAELEVDGYIDRSPDPDDARRNVVALTSDGAARHTALVQAAQDAQDEILQPLDAAQREAMLLLLRALQP